MPIKFSHMNHYNEHREIKRDSSSHIVSHEKILDLQSFNA